jgi:uncharacterized repeat protein (TIGR01451 family)
MPLFGLLLVALSLAFVPPPAHAAPAAGTVIGNQATATYTDQGGVARSASSNLVQTTITQVRSFTVAASGARSAAPGQTVYYPHVITNTGNGTDTYALNPPATGGSFAHTGLAYFIDANGDGIPDNSTPITTTGPLVAGGSFQFVVAGTVPGGAIIGQSGTITVSVSDTSPVTDTSNVDTTTVSDCALAVTKSMSVTSGGSPNNNGGAHITVTLSYRNSGTASCSNAEIRDLLPAGFAYVAGSARWSVSGATPLTDALAGDPAGIAYDFGNTVASRATAIIATVAAGASGNLTFLLDVNGGLAVTTAANQAITTNTASFSANAGPFVNSNSVLYTVLQSAGVVASDNPLQPGDAVVNDVVEVPVASPGSTVSFANRVTNTGNGVDSFDVTLAGQASWPPGTTFAFFQADGVTPLIDTNGNGTPDTGPVNPGQTTTVVVKATLPAAAPNAVYNLTMTATSRFNPAISDPVVDRLYGTVANTVDLTNNTARSDSTPPGTAAAGNAATTGFGATGTTVIVTNPVTPSDIAPTVTRFPVFVNNTSGVADSFNLAAAGIPAGWTVTFAADGGAGNCSTTGAALANTGPIAAGANRLVCAVVTVPTSISGNAAPGLYNLDFTAASATNPAVADSIRDAVAVNALHRVTLVPNNAQQTFAGGVVTYAHTITNVGSVPETVTYASGCLADSRAAQGWTSTAYIDTNPAGGNGTLEVGLDTAIACGATSDLLAVGQSRTIFVRVVAPLSATAADPANVTTITATYNAGAASASATDTTTVTDGLTVAKEQRTVQCDGTAPGAYVSGPIAAGPLTAPGNCIGYRLTVTNAAASNVTSITVADPVPANTRMFFACGVPATTLGAMDVASAADGAPPPAAVRANVGTLAPAQSAVVTFCVRIDP